MLALLLLAWITLRCLLQRRLPFLWVLHLLLRVARRLARSAAPAAQRSQIAPERVFQVNSCANAALQEDESTEAVEKKARVDGGFRSVRLKGTNCSVGGVLLLKNTQMKDASMVFIFFLLPLWVSMSTCSLLSLSVCTYAGVA